MLTDAFCRKAKPLPRETPEAKGKDRKLADSKGLYLTVRPTGSKIWRFKYRFGGKEKLLVIGPYPEISLIEARDARDKARALLRDGIDPSIDKKQRKAASLAEALDTFEAAARAWHRNRAETLNARYSGQIMSRFEENIFPTLGALPIKAITAPMVLAALRSIEARGAKEMAHRVRGHMSDVFVWAISSGLTETDPAAVVRKALTPTDGKLRPALLALDQARDLLAKTERMQDIYWATHLASRLLALTAARPGVIRRAERSEFEGLGGTEPIWRIPAEKMKLTRERKKDATFEFIIPLAPEAVEVVRAAMQASTSEKWLFPGIGDKRKPISDSTLSKHYREAGFTGLHVPHGWRSTFSTIMNRNAAQAGRKEDREIIDLMLAHIPEGVEAIYNRHLYMQQRRQIAEAWGKMLFEGMQEPWRLIPPALG
jgi:integrase